MNWYQNDPVICPDCRRELGRRSLTGYLQIVSPALADFPECIHKSSTPSAQTQCPRVLEAVAEAKRTAVEQS